MPRNKFTRLIHESERAQIERQEEEMAELGKSLNRRDADIPLAPAVDEDKERREIRRELKRRHKPERFRGANEA
ncbi:hypothetical protein [Streptomyces sp. NPDC054829]